MGCDRYLELLSLRLDGVLTEAGERELEEHLTACPDCRAAGAQLAALQGAFSELEEGEAPEGFAQGVMDRIRAEEKPKVVPLFKRPQVRALAGLAACLVLAVGLYGGGHLRWKTADWEGMVRSFSRNAAEDFADVSTQEPLDRDGDSPRVNATLVGPEAEDAPQIAAYAAPETDTSAGTAGMERDSTADGLEDNRQKVVPDMAYAEFVLTLDRMPEGAWELIPPETPVSPEGVHVTVELFEEIEQLAVEQGITASVTTSGEEAEEFVIVVLEESE